MNSPNDLSFLPDDYLESKARRRANVFCGTLFAVSLAAIGAAFTFTERAAHDAARLHDAKMRQYSDEARRIAQADELKDKQRQLAHQADLAASLLEKVPRSFLLADVTNALPAGVSLLEFTLESRVHVDPPPTAAQTQSAYEQRKAALEAAKSQSQGTVVEPMQQAKVYDVYLKMTGLAATDVQVAQFISHLNGCKRMKDVNLVISEEFKKDDDSVRKFQVEATLNPDADVRRDAKDAAQAAGSQATAGQAAAVAAPAIAH